MKLLSNTAKEFWKYYGRAWPIADVRNGSVQAIIKVFLQAAINICLEHYSRVSMTADDGNKYSLLLAAAVTDD